MSHATLKLSPGVNTIETPTLNQTSCSATQLIRFFYDPSGLGLPAKLGGWARYFPYQMPSTVRALWAWEDTDAVAHLAVGMQTLPASSSAELAVITNGTISDITPRATTDDVTPAAATTSGSATVTITDATTTGITVYDAVFIQTHMAVGGLILFGIYQCETLSPTTYQIVATDVLGNQVLATATTSTTAVASFATVNTTSVVTVTLANHGYSVGSTYPALVSTTVGGVTIFGNYIVQTVPSANTFTINAATNATSTTSASINGGNAQFTYSFGVGAIPSGTGFGIGGFGRGGFGTGTGIVPSTGTAINATDWTLDNFGEVLLAVPINGTIYQPIYQFDPLSGSPTATVIASPQAPTVNDGAFVAMPQRQIIAWGSTETGIQDPLLIRWCDINNFNTWVDLPTNQAGAYRLPRGSRIVAGMQGPQQALIWTDLAVWSMQYIDLPDVWGFNQIGSGCGLIGRHAYTALGQGVYWMGAAQFFEIVADGVQAIPCPIWDTVFQNLDQTNLTKVRAASNALFNEVTWYYPSLQGGGEVDSYVKYNTLLQAWDYGKLARTAWIDQSVLGPPIGADPSSRYLYQHETSTDADGQPLQASFTTGYFALQEGEWKTFVDQIWPDMKWGYANGAQNATVNLTIYGADYPGQTPVVYGPYSLTQATTFVTPRIRSRLISIQMSSSDIGTWWRLGAMRYRVCPDGKF